MTFLVEDVPEGGFKAHAVGAVISAEAATREDLRQKIWHAVRSHDFAGRPFPQAIRLRFVQEEVLNPFEPRVFRDPDWPVRLPNRFLYCVASRDRYARCDRS